MSYEQNAQSNKVPIFGVPGTVTIDTSTTATPSWEGTARSWDLTGIQVADGQDLVEHRDANGMIVSRNHFNRDTNGVNRSRTISITFIPVGSDAAAALTAGAPVKTGMKFKVENSTVPGANGNWECTGYQCGGTNTDNVNGTLSGVWHVDNA